MLTVYSPAGTLSVSGVVRVVGKGNGATLAVHDLRHLAPRQRIDGQEARGQIGALASGGRLVGEAGVEGPVEVDADGVGKGVGSTGERFIQ